MKKSDADDVPLIPFTPAGAVLTEVSSNWWAGREKEYDLVDVGREGWKLFRPKQQD